MKMMSAMSSMKWYKITVIAVVISCVMVQSVCVGDDQVAFVNVNEGDDCPPWYIFDAPRNRCICSSEGQDHLKCTDKGVLLQFGSCMTYEDENTTAVGRCPYFSLQPVHNITDQRYITLPRHLSDLNDYVCGPMNRKGELCSECINGFGPSLTSLGHPCTDCTGAWYGIPLFLFLEFAPVTVLYVTLVYFQISLTSAPMTSFLLFSQLSVYAASQIDPQSRIIMQIASPFGFQTFVSLATFYSVFNLDFFRYIIPPFCISPNLKIIHVVLLGYLSAYYPLFLIAITYCLCTNVKYCNCKSISCSQTRIFQHFFKSQKVFNIKNSMVDVFASFLLLSYTKFMLIFTSFIGTLRIVNIDGSLLGVRLGVDPSVSYFGTEHIPLFIFGTLSMIGPVITSALLLTLYPIKCIRFLLLRSYCGGRTKAALNIFVEKFHSCYRDGLDGGKDMRSFAGYYFLVRFLALMIVAALPPSMKSYGIATWTATALLFAASSLLIAVVRPYKETYMNITDALILFNVFVIAAFTSLFFISTHFPNSIPFSPGHLLWIVIIGYCIPMIGFFAYFVVKFARKLKAPLLWTKMKKSCWTRKNVQCDENSPAQSPPNNDHELPDRVLHPEEYYTDYTGAADTCSV